MRESDATLRGRTVIGGDGKAVGEVTAVFVDTAGWRIESMQVKLRKEAAERLGAQRSLFHSSNVEIPIRLVQSVGDAIVLAVGVDGLRQALPGEGESASAP